MKQVEAGTFLDALKLNFASGFSELGEVRLCIGLILADQCFGERNVFDEALIDSLGKRQGGFAFLFTQCINNGQRDVIKLLSLSGAAIVDTGNGLI